MLLDSNGANIAQIALHSRSLSKEANGSLVCAGYIQEANLKLVKYGGVFWSNLLGSPTIVATTVKSAKFFLSCTDCGPSGLFARLLGPETINEVIGSQHALYRRIILGMMVPETLKCHVQMIDILAQETLESWGSKKMFSYCTVIGLVCQKLLPSTPEMIDLMRDILMIENGARARLHRFLDGLINKRRAELAANSETHKDALDEFITHKDDKAGFLSNQQVEDNLVTLLFGGHHTTALALVWLMKHLNENPQAFKEVEATPCPKIG
ncbi:abscisic acid 8'-hydroxylase 3 [Selaginella moellendorffii]|uniref:abscisic acid 8'-hydroxylase 3 n=1 Tax=Selaginella moellendorffii TaxID=88036 RepID=UPI000D1CA6B7|nr:abscisic acid 8'-hydroxylase 3 [Selaginella moellendorffii]|eukprot:XP_024536548.1 abscisic acid 8'-hydroxylase 3 [Selaginella moellendorffii]